VNPATGPDAGTAAADPGAGTAGAGRSRSVTARALALLGAFDVDHPRLTLTELSRRAGLPLATVHRLARELEQWRALERDDRGRYGVGLRVWEMGMLAPVHSRLREVALPYLLALHAATSLNIQLAACDGFDAVYVEKLTSSHAASTLSRVGGRLPLHATAAGKALLAFQSPAFVEALLQRPLARYTEHTVTDRATLRRALAQIRRDGYAASRQEYREGASGVAVPVFAGGEATACVGILADTLRDDLDRFLPSLRAAAAGIASRLEASGE
jgi:DNA-binding IclR family transcriptional regulator